MTTSQTNDRPQAAAATVDVTFTREHPLSTIILVTPMTEAAREWIDEHVAIEPWQWLGAGFGCDERSAFDLCRVLLGEGFNVE